MTRVAELEKQAQKAVPGLPASFVADMAGPQAKESWDRLQPAQRRSLLAAMGFDLELVAGMRGGPGCDDDAML